MKLDVKRSPDENISSMRSLSSPKPLLPTPPVVVAAAVVVVVGSDNVDEVVDNDVEAESFIKQMKNSACLSFRLP